MLYLGETPYGTTQNELNSSSHKNGKLTRLSKSIINFMLKPWPTLFNEQYSSGMNSEARSIWLLFQYCKRERGYSPQNQGQNNDEQEYSKEESI